MEEGKGPGFILGLLMGTLVGAAIAVLMTPASGEETREFLRKKAYEPAKTKVIGIAEDVRVKATDFADEVKDKATEIAKDLKERAGEIWEKGKKVMAEKQEDLEAFAKNTESSSRLT